jgi:hypothetical protein
MTNELLKAKRSSVAEPAKELPSWGMSVSLGVPDRFVSDTERRLREEEDMVSSATSQLAR